MTQAAVVHFGADPRSVELRQIEAPTIGPDDVLLRVGAVGVCGSDVHQWLGRHTWPVQYPVVLGHEFAGVIEQVGERADPWHPGDRVVSETAAVIDPNSAMSRCGLYNLDPSRKGFGAGADGGMTSLVRVPARCLHRVPEALTLEQAALTEPASVAYNAVVNNAEVHPGDRVVVLGPGPIGLLCAAMARLRGAEVAVVGLERDRQRLEVAVTYGCEPIVDDLSAWTTAGGRIGADGVVDATGVSESLRTALDIVRPAGWVTKVGWSPTPLGFSIDPLVQKNVTLRGSFSHNWPVWERVLQLLASGALAVEPLLGGVWPLADWQVAFTQMHEGDIVKAVLRP